ncbi:hypothetical protein AB0L13_38840 [Saccharopolyspora shandongensis]|uniref:hypothetical protein n=1 Tax=Saccharopolyspora shandongensis TaxID=418495 RepID=UPI00343EC37C
MDDVVPARPDFTKRWRGFDQAQVVEHVALLEAELRRLYEEFRAEDADVPSDSEIVEFAEKRATTLIEQARTEAAVLLAEAERVAEQIRTQASDFACGLAERQAALDRETARRKREQREREHRLRRKVQAEYKRITAIAQDDAEGLLDQTRRRCERRNAESEAYSRRICEKAEERKLETGAALESLLHEVVKHSTAIRGLSLPNDGCGETRTEEQAAGVETEGLGISKVSEADTDEQHLRGA